MNFFSFMDKFKKESAEKATPAVAPAPPVVPATETKETVPPAADQATPENKPADQAAANTAGQTNQANAPVQTPATQSAPVAATQAPAEKGSLLVINFRENLLQIQKKDGAVIAEYIGKPGENGSLK